MRPGRRYCLWSVGIGELLVLGFLVSAILSDEGSYPGDTLYSYFVVVYWALICTAGAFLGWTTWAMRIGFRHVDRLSLCRG